VEDPRTRSHELRRRFLCPASIGSGYPVGGVPDSETDPQSRPGPAARPADAIAIACYITTRRLHRLSESSSASVQGNRPFWHRVRQVGDSDRSSAASSHLRNREEGASI
jgi:hypothetical protein